MQPTQSDINELLFRLLDNEISDQEFVRLREWLDSDMGAKRYYCQFMNDYGALSLRMMTAVQTQEDVIQDELLDENFWHLMSEEEQKAPAVEILLSEGEPERDIIQKVQRQPIGRTVNKTSLFVAVVSLAALLAMVAYVRLVPPAPFEVATVLDSMNAAWSSKLPLKAGTHIATSSKPIQLTHGIVKLVTDDNVEVVLEAPTEFRFVSYSEVAMNYGKLYAHVSEEGRGFSVATPNAKVVDLGTDFGVLCHIDGNTEVHMYKGKANVFAGQRNEKKISELLLADSAMKIDRSDSVVKKIRLEKDKVVRNIDSASKFLWRGETLSLADLVGGGDGFGGGRPDEGIDPLTGRVIHSLPRTEVYTGPKEYVPVKSNPYIDGVFVPGGGSGIDQITFGGLTTDAFGRTSGKVWGYLFNGAWHCGIDDSSRHYLLLDGVALGDRQNPALTMHSNLGVTFDLSAIRRSLPGMKIQSFSSDFGVSETVEKWIKFDFVGWERTAAVEKLASEKHSSAQFWVLLDGEVVASEKLSSVSKAGKVNIPIDANVRFLTLAVTESDDTFMFDWGVFARPELILESADSPAIIQ